MVIKTIKDPDRLKIVDEETGHICYGGSQSWYSTRWKRLSGCGPTVVSNIISYLLTQGTNDTQAKRRFQKLMEEVWRYVTPTLRGIPNTEILLKGISSYIEAKNLDLMTEHIDIGGNTAGRPEFGRLLEFIGNSLDDDMPLAFLNLDNGDEKQLDSWHWVTVISAEYEEDGSKAHISFADEGRIVKINLYNWYKTTAHGGGFVRLKQKSRTV